MRRRRQVRIAHAEVDDIGAPIARRRLGAIDLFENVGRQAPNAVKLFHGPGSFGLRGDAARADRRRAFYHGLSTAAAALAASAARLRAAAKSPSSFVCSASVRTVVSRAGGMS